jgi:hypothetical protein
MGCTQELAPESRFSEPHVRLQPNINMKFSKSYRSVEFEVFILRSLITPTNCLQERNTKFTQNVDGRFYPSGCPFRT